MKRERISAIYADAASFTGREITVCGWARTIRDMKNFGFVALNDGSSHGNLQVVLERAALANYDEIARQNVGAALIVRGELVLTPEAKQPFELKASSVEVEGPSHARLSPSEEAPQHRVPAHDTAPAPAPRTSSTPSSASGASPPRRYTSSSSSAASSTSTPRL